MIYILHMEKTNLEWLTYFSKMLKIIPGDYKDVLYSNIDSRSEVPFRLLRI